jgi:hypothetical protein
MIRHTGADVDWRAGLQTLALGLLFNVSGTLVNIAVAWLAGSARTLLESRGGRA